MVDPWAADEAPVRAVYEPLIDLIWREVAPEHRELYPAPVWEFTDRVGHLARNILLAEFLVREWAEHFAGKSDAEIDALARSFAFSNCLRRESLTGALAENASLAAGK